MNSEDAPKRTRKRARAAPKKYKSEKHRQSCHSPERLEALKRAREAYRAKYGNKPPSRRGYPDGVRGKTARKAFVEALERATQEAKTIVEHLIKEGKLDKDAAGNDILVDMSAIVLARKEDGKPYYGANDRIKAASTALPYLIPKPESKQSISVQTAEDFLAGVYQAATKGEQQTEE